MFVNIFILWSAQSGGVVFGKVSSEVLIHIIYNTSAQICMSIINDLCSLYFRRSEYGWSQYLFLNIYFVSCKLLNYNLTVYLLYSFISHVLMFWNMFIFCYKSQASFVAFIWRKPLTKFNSQSRKLETAVSFYPREKLILPRRYRGECLMFPI